MPRARVKRAAKATDAPRRAASKQETSEPAVTPGEEQTAIQALAHQVRSWADSVLGVASTAADLSLSVAKSMLPKPEQKAAVEKAGSLLRSMREAAGMTIDELGGAINLKDPALLDLVENGKVALPFEIILRLASVLGRKDPIAFVMNFTRSYNPELWRTLESIGIGRLVVQAGREREFANVYRARDAARKLSDEEFAAALKLVGAAFDMALAFKEHAAPGSSRDDQRPRRASGKRAR